MDLRLEYQYEQTKKFLYEILNREMDNSADRAIHTFVTIDPNNIPIDLLINDPNFRKIFDDFSAMSLPRVEDILAGIPSECVFGNALVAKALLQPLCDELRNRYNLIKYQIPGDFILINPEYRDTKEYKDLFEQADRLIGFYIDNFQVELSCICIRHISDNLKEPLIDIFDPEMPKKFQNFINKTAKDRSKTREPI